MPLVATTACPLCAQGMVAGTTCSACSARYHVECGRLLGRCVAGRCRRPLPGSAGAGRVLPRVGAVARLLAGPRPISGAGLLGDDGPWVLYFVPPPGFRVTHLTEQATAEVMGQGEYDAKLRLRGAHPELLVRVDDRAQGQGFVRDLDDVGLPARLTPLRDLLAPLERREAVASAEGEPLQLTDDRGDRREVPEGSERLVIETRFREVHSRARQRLTSLHRGAGVPVYRSQRRETVETEDVVFLFLPGEPTPLCLRPSTLRRPEGTGRDGAGLAQRIGACQRLAARLARCAEARVVRLSDVEQPTHVHPVFGDGPRTGRDWRTNRETVTLMARLLGLAWRADPAIGEAGEEDLPIEARLRARPRPGPGEPPEGAADEPGGGLKISVRPRPPRG